MLDNIQNIQNALNQSAKHNAIVYVTSWVGWVGQHQQQYGGRCQYQVAPPLQLIYVKASR